MRAKAHWIIYFIIAAPFIALRDAFCFLQMNFSFAFFQGPRWIGATNIWFCQKATPSQSVKGCASCDSGLITMDKKKQARPFCLLGNLFERTNIISEEPQKVLGAWSIFWLF
ncbi:hypothetical protein BC940DRAFT_290270 [Gongronella butleri]|nr:hypothetical protein BC940DRAFT_290270 [Gongronella butleri]